MVAERCITIPLLKAELASVLVGAGIPAIEADRLAGLQAHLSRPGTLPATAGGPGQ